MDTYFLKIRQSAFIGLRKSHAIIRGRVKFVHLTVLVQQPNMNDKMAYNGNLSSCVRMFPDGGNEPKHVRYRIYYYVY
jgi:hypothetical protein